MLQKLWYDRPVRTQLLIAIGAINLIAALLAGFISIINTRTATRVEIEASLEIAQRFVTATMSHVRIMFMDTMGQLTVVSPQPGIVTRPAEAPRWFAGLVRPQLVGRAVRVVAIDHANPVIIIGEPSDEIAEA